MFRNFTIAFVFTTLSAFAATQAHAVQRTHLSAAIGDDINTAANCTPIAPCRTFQAAVGVTDVNGEVVVLDSGGYGAATITKSVALIAPTGVYAGISVFNGANGITVATPGINVVLNGLTINGQGGNNGIFMTAGNKLTIENCVISNLAVNGILVNGGGMVRVTKTIIRDNAANGIFLQDGVRSTITHATISGNKNAGIRAQGSIAGRTTTADIADSTLDGNFHGVIAEAFTTAVVNVSVRDSRAVRNLNDGLTTANASLTASNNIVSNNGAGGIVSGGSLAKVLASGNTVSDNDFGFISSSSGVFQSAGNNAVRNNKNDFSTGIEIISTK